jgi:very-short-patch-repair endonuclease
MTARRKEDPSPFTGEVAARSAAGEGSRIPAPTGILEPSPGRSLRSRPTSPVKGEGESAAGDRGLVRRARGLRSRMTKAERKLWYALRDRRFAGFKFRRQVPIGPFIADFVCFDQRLVIEVDGGQHADSPQDKRRDRWLAANKFRVLRFWNNAVPSNPEGVVTVLAKTLRVEWS